MNCRDLDVLFENGGESRCPMPPNGICQRARPAAGCGLPGSGALPSIRNAATSGFAGKPARKPSPVRPLSRTPILILTLIFSAALIWAAAIARWGLAGWGGQTPIERLTLFGTVVVALSVSAYGLSVEMVPGSKPRFDWRWVAACALGAFLVATLSALSSGGSLRHRRDPRGVLRTRATDGGSGASTAVYRDQARGVPKTPENFNHHRGPTLFSSIAGVDVLLPDSCVAARVDRSPGGGRGYHRRRNRGRQTGGMNYTECVPDTCKKTTGQRKWL